jgi:5-formyltetrahydrofolate cyclo-ligase
MNTQALKKAKRAIRREMLALRDLQTDPERAVRGAAIHAGFLALEEVARASTVSLFWSFGSEVPTQPLIAALDERGVRVLLPRIVGGDLQLHAYRPGDVLTDTAFGAREPAGGPIVAPEEVDVICTPSVAVDRAGRRLGYGGGFYDRLFPLATRAIRVGIAFALQLVDGDLPAGHFDRSLDVVVTEDETLRWRR